MPVRPPNRHNRSFRPPDRHGPVRSAWPAWPAWPAWLAAAVVVVWMVLFLRQPIWSTSLPPGADQGNGPRWFLLLAPDAMLAGWFQGPVTAAGLGQRLAVLAVAACIAAAAYATGRPLVALSTIADRLRPLERRLLATATGLSVVSLATLVAGLAGTIGRSWSAPLILTMSVAIPWGIARLGGGHAAQRSAAGDSKRPAAGDPPRPAAGDLKRSPTGDLKRSPAGDPVAAAAQSVPATGELSEGTAALPRWTMHVAWIVASLLGCVLVARAMMPPAEYDVREYHLQAPKEWSAGGRITFLPHNIYANMPMGAEMHALLAMDMWRIASDDDWWWWGAISGKTIIAGYALLAAGLVGCVVSRLAGPAAGGWATAMTLATPVMAEGATLGLIESALACYLAAGLVIAAACRSADAAPRASAAAWIGFFAGSAVACKYPAVLLVVLPLLAASQLIGGQRAARRRLAELLAFALLAAAAGGPWLIKNAVLAGNPVYPLAASVLGGKTMTPDKIAQWNAAHRTGAYSPAAAAASMARLSWRMQTQSAIVVPLAVAGVILGWRRREVRWLAAGVALSLVLWWLLTHRIERFLVPALPLVLILAGTGWRGLAAAWGPRLATAAVIFGTAVDGLIVAGPVLGDTRIAVDLRYLRRDAGSETRTPLVPEHVRLVNDQLDDADRLLVVGDAAVFDYAVPLDYATTFDRSPLVEITQVAPASRWRKRLQIRGYTHLLVHWGEIQRLRSTYGFDPAIDHSLLTEMQQSGAIEPLRMGLSGGAVDLYRVVLIGDERRR